MPKASVVSVGTSATLLTPAPDGNYGTSSVILTPAAAMFVGGSTVTTGNGFPVAAGQTLSVDLDNWETVYGVCASGTVSVNVLQTGIG